MDPFSLVPAMKSSSEMISNLKSLFDIIKGAILLLRDKQSGDRGFWLHEVLEPLHTAMSSVHEIYMETFQAAWIDIKDVDGKSLQEILEFAG